MSDIDEVVEEGGSEQEAFECPSCGQQQTEFLYHSSRRGWVKCQSCGKYVRKKEVPDKFVKYVKLEDIEPEEEKKKGEVEEEEYEELYEEGGGRVPFRRPRPVYIILKQILDEFGVKSAAKKIITARCRRVGELHPTEVQRMLMDLDSGLNHKETGYVADEYYFALQSERQEAEEYEGMTTYPKWERGEGYSGATSGWGVGPRHRYESRPIRYPVSQRAYTTWRSWEESGAGGTLTEDRLLEILDRRDREFEDRLQKTKMEDTLTNLMKQMIQLQNEIKNIKENPPTTIPFDVVTKADLEKNRADSYMKMLERQVDTLEKAVDKYESALKEAEAKHENILEKIESRYREEIKDLQKKVEEQMSRTVRTTEGYKDDSVRLAAEALNRAADILEKKEPVRAIGETLTSLANSEDEEKTLAPLERVGEQSITEQLPPDFVEG